MANTVGFDFSNTQKLAISLEAPSPESFIDLFVEDTIKTQREYVLDKFFEYAHNPNNSVTIPTSNDEIIESAIDLGIVNTHGVSPNTVNLTSNAQYTTELSNSDILTLLTSNSDIQTMLTSEINEEIDAIISMNYDSYRDFKIEDGQSFSFTDKDAFLQQAIDEGFLIQYDESSLVLDPNFYYEN